jgi:hypothetical protein
VLVTHLQAGCNWVFTGLRKSTTTAGKEVREETRGGTAAACCGSRAAATAPTPCAEHQSSGARRGGAAVALGCAALGVGACIALDDDIVLDVDGEDAAEDAAISVQSSIDVASSLRTPSAASLGVSPPWGSPNSYHTSSLDRGDPCADQLPALRLEPFYQLMREGFRPDFMFTDTGLPTCLCCLAVGFQAAAAAGPARGGPWAALAP